VSHHVRALKKGFCPGCEIRFPSLLRDETHGFAKGVLRDYIGGEAVEGFLDVEGCFPSGFEKFVDGEICKVENFGFEFDGLLAGEEAREGASAETVQVVGDGGEASHRNGAGAPGVELVLPFVAGAAGAGVDFVDEEGVVAVEFVGVDADDGAYDLLEVAQEDERGQR
jgi:hypothetical protein